MRIKIVCIAPDDGWAFIEKENETFLLRPPYVSSNIIKVPKRTVEDALYLPSFEECDIVFNSISEVVKFLKSKYVESKSAQGIGLPSSEQLKELLRYAPDDVLIEYLQRIEKDLCREGEFDVAESLALKLMELAKLRNNPDIQDKSRDVLEKCCGARRKMKELTIGISDSQRGTWKDRFPHAVDTYSLEHITRCQKSISARRQLLPAVSQQGVSSRKP